MEGYYITLAKPINNIIPASYCDNILNHGINEGIVKLVTLMLKGNETITKMRVLQLQIRTLLKYTINMTYIALLSCTYTNNFALIHL